MVGALLVMIVCVSAYKTAEGEVGGDPVFTGK